MNNKSDSKRSNTGNRGSKRQKAPMLLLISMDKGRAHKGRRKPLKSVDNTVEY